MRLCSLLLSHLCVVVISALEPPPSHHYPLREQDSSSTPDHISPGLFASLERLSRLVDITYCVGTTGITPPFTCASRCKDFPTLDLVTTWNTGPLMSDSCGYIAVDHGTAPTPRVSPITGERNQGEIIVAFRGTYSIANTIVDLSTIPQEYVPYPSPGDGGSETPREPEHICHDCTVHMGFLASWKVTRDVVLPVLKPLHEKYPEYPIHLVGHSLGGAVAALAALELKVIPGWDKLVVTTFGEPRVGNDGFVEYLDSVFELGGVDGRVEERSYRRVTHVDDPVPLLPLSEWGYRSHAGEFFISKSDLPPEPSDIRPCIWDYDPKCIAGSIGEDTKATGYIVAEEGAHEGTDVRTRRLGGIPSRYNLWQLFFAHRDYFWRLGLCVPGGDPIDWGRERYPNFTSADEL
ncbi:hypothetical protein AAE478_000955 [Parahypoxylon ruwenzoriense]